MTVLMHATGYLCKKSGIWSYRCGSFLLGWASEAEKSFLLGGLYGGRQEILIMFRADEAWIAIFLQQKRVHVFRSNVKCEPRRCLQALLNLFHGFAVNVDLARCSGLQKLPNMTKDRRLDDRMKSGEHTEPVLCTCWTLGNLAKATGLTTHSYISRAFLAIWL